MNKYLIFFCLFISLPFFVLANKKKKKQSIENIHIESVLFTNNHNSVRNKGRIYEIKLQTKTDGILIDSIWFGSTPVPCDIYQSNTYQRTQGSLPKGNYIIKANQDLYKNFSHTIDSSEASQNFIQPFTFKGIAVLMYLQAGKRNYKIIKYAKEISPKPLR